MPTRTGGSSANSLQSEMGDKIRAKASLIKARAEELEAKAARADRLDAEKQAKARDASIKKAEKEMKDPSTFVAEKVKLERYKDMYGRTIVVPKVGDEALDIGNNGYEMNKITNRSFDGINSKFEPLLREQMIEGIKEITGMSKKKATETADKLTEKIRKEIGDFPTPLQYIENAKNRELELAKATQSNERFASLRKSQEYAEGRDYDGDNAIAASAKEHGIESTARYWKEDLIPALKNVVAKSGGFENASTETVAWANNMLNVVLPQARLDFKQAKWKTGF
jgi:hypothetical protein